jgi:hypothetical protein
VVYATKGNGTGGFWRYAADSLAWAQMPDVPLGPSGKKVKGGTDMVYVVENDTGYVYLLKGLKQDFFRFNTVSGVWDTSLPPAPAGARPKWDKGSWLVYDGMTTLYAHKAKYHELWTFDIVTHTWGTAALPGMPLVGSMGKSKKSKDGGCAAYYGGALYALKGGNTQEFWKFTIATNAWVELETMPAFGSTAKKKRVKAGGDIVSFGGGAFFAFKGNKTNELWRYVAAAPAGPCLPEGAQSGATAPVARGPALVSGRLVSYSLPGSGPVGVSVVDVTGRTVLRQTAAARAGTLDLTRLSAGVYLARFEGAGLSTTRKLVIE